MTFMIHRLIAPIFISSLMISSAGCVTTQGEALPADERTIVNRILDHWKTWVPQKQKEGTAPVMTFEELYEGLEPSEQAFLDLSPGAGATSASKSSGRKNNSYCSGGATMRREPGPLGGDLRISRSLPTRSS